MTCAYRINSRSFATSLAGSLDAYMCSQVTALLDKSPAFNLLLLSWKTRLATCTQDAALVCRLPILQVPEALTQESVCHVPWLVLMLECMLECIFSFFSRGEQANGRIGQGILQKFLFSTRSAASTEATLPTGQPLCIWDLSLSIVLSDRILSKCLASLDNHGKRVKTRLTNHF